jgi:hypothetical protein
MRDTCADSRCVHRCPISALVLASALVAAGSATAAGGTSIAAAPIVRAGVEATGDTAGDSTADGSVGSDESPGCWNDVEYWRLRLAAGDEVSIKGTAVSPAYHFGIGIFPAGTSDRNIGRAVAFMSDFPKRNPIRYAARSSGTYPLVIGPTCYNGLDGPYTFAVTVRHKPAT